MVKVKDAIAELQKFDPEALLVSVEMDKKNGVAYFTVKDFTQCEIKLPTEVSNLTGRIAV